MLPYSTCPVVGSSVFHDTTALVSNAVTVSLAITGGVVSGGASVVNIRSSGEIVSFPSASVEITL